MSISISVSTRASFLAATMLAGWVALTWVALATPAFAADANHSNDADRVSALLSDAKSYTRSNLSWEVHTKAIVGIRENVNKMGALLTQLQDSRKDAAPWQQTAIDRVVPLAKELAANTTTAIEAINKNPRHVNLPAYQEYLEAIYDSANNLANTIADFTDYGKTRERLDRLAKKLELPN